MLSRNSASSRAIPTEKHIQRVLDHPFVPLTFNKRVKGMGVGDELEADLADFARLVWEAQRDAAVSGAKMLSHKILDVDKSRANRLLEPFMWHTAIVSATEWDNFFALRDHPAAQPEFRILAEMMREEYEQSDPTFINQGEWALPLTPDFPMEDMRPDWDRWKKISASRCARVSYDRHTDSEPIETTVERAERMLVQIPPHLSSFEHVARPFTDAEMQAAINAPQPYEDDCRDFGWEFDPQYADSFYFGQLPGLGPVPQGDPQRGSGRSGDQGGDSLIGFAQAGPAAQVGEPPRGRAAGPLRHCRHDPFHAMPAEV
jgi:hypothetical protein